MRRRRRRALAVGRAIAVLTAFMVGGCTSDSDEAAPSSTTTTEAAPGVALDGRVFAVAGERSATADLYELQTAPLRLVRLTEVGRVSTLGGCETMLVLAAAQADVGLVDTIQAFRNGRLGPVEGLGTPRGFAPALKADDCRLAYTDVDQSGAETVHRLHVWDPKTRTDNIVERAAENAPHPAGFDWGPGGRLAVVLNTGGAPGKAVASTTLVIVGADGSRQTLPAPAPDLGALYWGSSSTMAFVRIDAKATLLFNPDTGTSSELAGWWPVAWSPDGRQLLLTDADNAQELAVVAAGDLSSVERVGTAPVGVYGGVWLPADAAPI